MRSSAYVLTSRYGCVCAYAPEVPVAGGGEKNSSTRSGSSPYENPWCHVSRRKKTLSPGSARTISPVSGFASTRVPWRTWSSSSAAKIVRKLSEWREPSARRHPEHDRVDHLGRDVDPVLDEAGFRVAPGVADDLVGAQHGRRVEGRAGRGLIAHRGCAGRGRTGRAPTRATARSSPDPGKSLSISRATPSCPAACAASMISSAW